MRKLYIFRWLRLQSIRVLRTLFRARGTPHAIALGAAIGVFVGMTPTVGLQMLIGVFIATLVGASRVAAALPAWITNPVTIVPIYSFNYWVGSWFFRSAPDLERFRSDLYQIRQLSAHGGFGDALGHLLDLGGDALLPLWLGCVLVGSILAVPTYLAVRWLVVHFRQALARKRAARQDRITQRLETGMLVRPPEPEGDGEGATTPAVAPPGTAASEPAPVAPETPPGRED